MKTFLSELGFESESFSSGEETMNAVNAGNASCVITGLTLADMSGEELVKRLAVSSEAMLKIVVTSSDNEALSNRLKALGVKTIIQKSGDWKKELSKIFGKNSS
jgi:FixJ family two-component response regulator